MQVENIMRKAESGHALDKAEVLTLMVYAIDLMKFVKSKTLISMTNADSMIAQAYKKAA